MTGADQRGALPGSSLARVLGPAPTSWVDFRILGPLEVRDGGVLIPIRGARQRGLLAMLLLRANAAVSVDELIGGLWGEQQPENAKNSIHVGISRLRRALESEAPREGTARCLVTHPRGYALEIDPEQLDLTRFERLAREGRAACIRGDPATAAARFSEALSLWRGPPLADFAGEPFADIEAAGLEDARLSTLEDRIEVDLALGAHNQLVGELEALVAKYPMRERFRAALMLSFYRSGRQAEALDAYREARRAFVEELGIEPGLALQELERAILRQDPALDSPPVPDHGAPIPLADELCAGTPSFIGRKEELAVLTAAWQTATRGEARLVLVTGQAGIGKTRLAARLAQLVHDRGGAALYANCGQREASPGRVVAEALRHAVPAFSEGDRAKLAAVEQDDDPALRDLIQALGRRAPVLLVLDDLHWAAAATLSFLESTVDETRELPLLVVATWAEAKLDPQHPLSVAVDALRGKRNVSYLYLTGLADEEVALLIRSLYPDGDTGAVEAIQREVEGNPKLVLEAVRGRIGEPETEDATGSPPCPYKGLAAFGRSDADVYFGREDELESLLGRLPDAHLLAIVGASGSGKSSLLAAGLLAAVSRGAVPQGEHWRVVTMRPGSRPVTELAAHLSAATGIEAGAILRDLEAGPEAVDLAARQVAASDEQARLLVVVDQFEEVFTQCRDEDERGRFTRALLHAAEVEGGRTSVVIALRADFYGHCAGLPGLAEALTANQVLLGLLDEDRLRTVIEQPAERVGLRLEPGLVETILPDVVGRPGVLPLLEHTLLETWHRRRARTLTIQGYQGSGGIRGALAKTADEVYLALDGDQQRIARAIFTRVTELGEGTEDTGRRVPLEEVETTGEREAVRAVVERFTAARLLTVDEAACELSHEALIRAWPRLREWLMEDRESLRTLRHLRDSTKAWEALGRDPGELYRGARLEAVLEWHDQGSQPLAGREEEFLAASRQLRDREAAEAAERLRRQGRQNRNLRTALAAAVLLLGVAIAGSVVAVLQRNRANDERHVSQAQQRIAEARRLAAQSAQILPNRPDTALLLGVEGFRLDGSREERGALLGALASRPGLLGYLHAQGGLLDIALSPDGKTLAEGDEDTPLQLWHFGAGPPSEQVLDLDSPGAMTFLPDGTLAAVIHDGHIERWDPATRRRVMKTALLPNDASIYAVATTRDGRTIAAAGDDGKVRLYDAAGGGQPVATFPLAGGTVWSLAFSPDGSLLAASADGGPAILYRVSDGTSRTLDTDQKGTYSVAWSPDGGTVAVGGADGTLAFWNAGTARQIGRPVQTVGGTTLLSLAFSRDGRILVASGADATARVLDGRTRLPLQAPFLGHSGSVLSTAISPDSSTLYTGGEDASIGIWSLAGRQALTTPLNDGGATVSAARFVRPGVAVTGGLDGVVRFWRLPMGRPLGAPINVGGPVTALDVSPDGRLLATGTKRGEVRLYDSATRTERGPPLSGQKGEISMLAFSPGGTRLASASVDGTVRLWDVSVSPAPGRVLPIAGKGIMYTVSFSPDGRLLAAGGYFGNVEFFDARSGTRAGKPYEGDRGVHSIAWRPDGKLVAVGVTGGAIRLVSLATRGLVGDQLEGHFQPPAGATFSADGRLLYTAAPDGTLRLWDVASSTPLGDPLTTGANERASLALSSDGKTLVTAAGPRALVWNVDPSTWSARACAEAGRNLTTREWRQYGPKGAYRVTCRGLPRPAK